MQRARKLSERERNGEVEKQKEISKEKDFLLERMNVGRILPRSMMVLDENISVALQKLGKIREIESRLPQTDCCVCGAPTCHALAEDIAMDKAQLSDCVFIQRNLEARKSMTTENAIEAMQKIWGKDKLKESLCCSSHRNDMVGFIQNNPAVTAVQGYFFSQIKV